MRTRCREGEAVPNGCRQPGGIEADTVDLVCDSVHCSAHLGVKQSLLGADQEEVRRARADALSSGAQRG